MITNYFAVALRSFLKHKAFTLLNILGLSIGMAASLFIMQYVKYERSYDTFHSKAKDIYRVNYNRWEGGKLLFECAAAVPAVGPALKNNFPEVVRFTRLYPVSGFISYDSPGHGRVAFREDRMHWADSSIFEVFDINLIKGDKRHALSGAGKAVISERVAKKYFGSEDPIGRTITWDGTRKLEVTGVFESLPQNSHIAIDFLFSYRTFVLEVGQAAENHWQWYDYNTYVLLEPGSDYKTLQAKWDVYLGKTRSEDWKKFNGKQEFVLQPLLDIHLGKVLLQESLPADKGNRNSVVALSVIALFILVIAWVNYINLATAKSFERANEVGVRKVMGARRTELMTQFLSEALVVNLLATLLSGMFVFALWPWFSAWSGRNIPSNFLVAPDLWMTVAILFLLGTLLFGFYPALVLSNFKPVRVLKGKLVSSVQGSTLRKGLVVFQFTSSVILIIGSIIVYQQLQFMQKQELGVNIKQTLVVSGPKIVVDSLFRNAMEGLKAEALLIPEIKSVTGSSTVPGKEIFWSTFASRLSRETGNDMIVYLVGMDHDYVDAFDLKILEGRNFDNTTNGRKSVIVNRSMVSTLGYENPVMAVGDRIRLAGDTMEIIGVLDNYHQMSLKEQVTPLLYLYTPQFATFLSFKIDGNNNQNVLSKLEGIWKAHFPDNPLEFFFLDEFYKKQYDSEERFSQMLSMFTGLAIFVACMGLFGLASLLIVQRTKEIGIRKALGSTSTEVMLLLSKGFIQLVIVANIIAWPLAYIIMTRWLMNFPYRISITPWLFLLAGLVVLIVAFISVSLQTLKAASVNPAKTLRTE